MLAVSDPVGWAAVITAVGVLIGVLTTSVVTIIAALSQARRDHLLHTEVIGVHDELRTLNGQTVGQMTDANETRRIEAIPEVEQSAAEQEHVAIVPPLDEPT